MRWVVLLFLVGQCSLGSAQLSQKELSLDAFVKLVSENHPVFYQADLIDVQAKANLLMSRGGFDPKLEIDLDGKAFDSKNYYNLLSAGVKIPTWYGIEVKGGYDRSSGVFLDDSDVLPSGGLFYGGVSVPLGKGLIIDNRRAELRKAQIFVESSVQLQRQMKNEILYEAMEAYLNWQQAYLRLEVAQDGVEIAENRFQASISSFENGDKPAIDTLESLIAVQNRNIERTKAEQELVKAIFDLNNYLWVEGEIPLELEEGTYPEALDEVRFSSQTDSLFLIKDQIINQHPELLTYEYKLQKLDVERRLGLEALKPDLRVGYNPLYEANTNFLPTENYKVGIAASYPLFLRKERGKLGMTNAKIGETGYDFALKQTSLSNKLEMYYRLQEQLRNQNILIASTVENYLQMVVAENRRFSIGESSVFLVNSREIKYLDSRYKLIEGQRQQVQARLLFLLYSGILSEVVI